MIQDMFAVIRADLLSQVLGTSPPTWINCATCEGAGGWPAPAPDNWRDCPDCQGEEGHFETGRAR